MKLLKYCVLYLIFSLVSFYSYAIEVEMVSPSKGNIPEELRTRFGHQLNEAYFDFNHTELTQEMAPKVEQLVKAYYAQEKGPHKKLFIIPLDLNEPNAFYSELKTGEKIVGFSTGLLRFVDNDDQFGAVIGHEINHGTSDLQKEVNRILSNDKKDNTIAHMLQRSVENEVDARGMLYMPKAGHSPYAMYELQDKFLKEFGDHISDSHTSHRSRKDTAAATLTTSLRKLDLEIEGRVDKGVRKNTIVAPMQDKYFASEDYNDLKYKKLIEIVENSVSTTPELLYQDMEANRDSIVTQYKKRINGAYYYTSFDFHAAAAFQSRNIDKVTKIFPKPLDIDSLLEFLQAES